MRDIITTENTALSKSTTHFLISISNKSTIRTKTKLQNQINQIHTRRLPASRCSCFRDDVEELGSTWADAIREPRTNDLERKRKTHKFKTSTRKTPSPSQWIRIKQPQTLASEGISQIAELRKNNGAMKGIHKNWEIIWKFEKIKFGRNKGIEIACGVLRFAEGVRSDQRERFGSLSLSWIWDFLCIFCFLFLFIYLI